MLVEELNQLYKLDCGPNSGGYTQDNLLRKQIELETVIEKLKKCKGKLPLEQYKKLDTFSCEFKKVRPKVLKRDNNKCVLCGSGLHLSVHHKIHRSNGGTNDIDNLITLCIHCHYKAHEGENISKLMLKRIKQLKFPA